MKLSQVIKNSNQYSKATYDMKTRSDGRLPDEKVKPKTAGDVIEREGKKYCFVLLDDVKGFEDNETN